MGLIEDFRREQTSIANALIDIQTVLSGADKAKELVMLTQEEADLIYEKCDKLLAILAARTADTVGWDDEDVVKTDELSLRDRLAMCPIGYDRDDSSPFGIGTALIADVYGPIPTRDGQGDSAARRASSQRIVDYWIGVEASMRYAFADKMLQVRKEQHREPLTS